MKLPHFTGDKREGEYSKLYLRLLEYSFAPHTSTYESRGRNLDTAKVNCLGSETSSTAQKWVTVTTTLPIQAQSQLCSLVSTAHKTTISRKAMPKEPSDKNQLERTSDSERFPDCGCSCGIRCPRSENEAWQRDRLPSSTHQALQDRYPRCRAIRRVYKVCQRQCRGLKPPDFHKE